MKKLLLLFFIGLMFSFSDESEEGKVLDNLSMTSKILNGKRNFSIYLPPNYENSEERYPILYLLHGAGDDHTGWIQFGEVKRITDRAISKGKIAPMIIVIPDADTGQRGYFNRGNWKYEDFFFDEFIPFIEKTYRVKSEKKYRAISGLSMGGGGTFMYALHRPELFSSACPLSAAVGMLPKDHNKISEFAKQANVPEAEMRAYFDNHSAISLIENLPAEKIKSVRWYIDCGDDDYLFEGNSLVHIAMKKKKIPHEYRVRDGGHTWSYWRESLPNVLEFVSEGFCDIGLGAISQTTAQYP